MQNECAVCQSSFDEEGNKTSNKQLCKDTERIDEQLQQTLIDFTHNPHIEDDRNNVAPPEHDQYTALTTDAEFMRWHYCLGHMHSKKMKRLAGLGYLPRKFSDDNINASAKFINSVST